VPWTRFPREMPERRRVMRKCVCGSPDAVGEEEDEEGCGVGEARRAATVREAVVPLWTEHRCIVRRVLRSPLGVRVGRTLSMVVAVQWQLARHERRAESGALSLVPLPMLRSALQYKYKEEEGLHKLKS
jgi:hypothetical protein